MAKIWELFVVVPYLFIYLLLAANIAVIIINVCIYWILGNDYLVKLESEVFLLVFYLLSIFNRVLNFMC